MGKAAAKRDKRTTTNEGEDPAVDYLAVFDAKQRFLGTVLNMGWRLALTFMIPVLLGAWLDSALGSKPSYTITGIFIAVPASIYVVWDTLKEVNKETAELEKDVKKVRKNAKRS